MIVDRRRRTPEERRNAHHVERVERTVIAAEPLRIAVAGPQHVADRGGNHPSEDRAAFSDVEELIDRISGPAAAQGDVRHPHAHQLLDMLVGKRVEHHRVEHAVDHGGGHDPGAQREDRESGKPGILQEAPGAEPHVLPE